MGDKGNDGRGRSKWDSTSSLAFLIARRHPRHPCHTSFLLKEICLLTRAFHPHAEKTALCEEAILPFGQRWGAYTECALCS